MKSNDFKIRPAVPDDVSLIHTMIRELAVFEKLEHQLTATVADLHQALFDSSQRSAEAMVAELDDGQLAGYAIYFENFSTFLCRRGIYLEDIYVRPEFRRGGIGKAFLQSLAKTAIDRNCGRMEWCVLDWNQTAIDVYESIGGTILQDWRIVRLDRDAVSDLAQS